MEFIEQPNSVILIVGAVGVISADAWSKIFIVETGEKAPSVYIVKK